MNSLPDPLQRFRPESNPAGFARVESPPAARVVAPGPGPLRSESWITLETMQAQRLVRGRKDAPGVTRIIGLAGFGSRLRSIWSAARGGDPYADWWLVRVHETLESASAELQVLTTHVEQVLARVPGVSVTAAHAVEPMRVPLAFSNPYGYRGAYLLARYDGLVRAVLTAEHVALMGRDPARRLVQDGGRQVRRAFLAAEGFSTTGATREDVRAGTARAVEACKRMGEVPAEILDGTVRALFSPLQPGDEPASSQGDADGDVVA